MDKDKSQVDHSPNIHIKKYPPIKQSKNKEEQKAEIAPKKVQE